MIMKNLIILRVLGGKIKFCRVNPDRDPDSCVFSDMDPGSYTFWIKWILSTGLSKTNPQINFSTG